MKTFITIIFLGFSICSFLHKKKKNHLNSIGVPRELTKPGADRFYAQQDDGSRLVT
jgi:hypothetical protein